MRRIRKGTRGVLGAGLLLAAASMTAAPAHAYLDAEAAYRMAVRYHTPLDGSRPNYAKAMILYCRADADGHARAAFGIGRLYAAGNGVRRNDGRAGAWFRRAVRLGNEEAKSMLALFRPRGAARCPRGLGRNSNARAALRVAPKKIKGLIEKMAPAFGLDPKLVLAVVAVESAFQPDAVSTANAQGLMQLIPETADRFGVRDPFDPADNLRGGMRYLKWLLRQFRGNVTLSLAAYNAGENAVRKFEGMPPYRETQLYVRKIRRLYEARTHPY